MGELNDIEDAIVALLEAVQINSLPAFKTVRGFSSQRSESIEEAIRRELKPAAYVTYDGRYSDVLDNFFHGQLMYSVVVAAAGYRSADEARKGGAGVVGAFDLMSAVTAALINQTILQSYTIAFRNEYTPAADERFMMLRQKYIVLGPGFAFSPTYDGQAICGSESLVRVRPQAVEADRAEFAFPGIDGVFRHHLGLRGRPVVWAGRLRAATDAALNTIESGLESLVAAAEAKEVVDGVGRAFADCVPDTFMRVGSRRYEPGSNRPTQDFELRFTQLSPES